MTIEERRTKLRSAMKNLVSVAEEIKQLMEDIPHPRGLAYRSLKPKSGEYIVDTPSGFSGRVGSYDIQVYRREETK